MKIYGHRRVRQPLIYESLFRFVPDLTDEVRDVPGLGWLPRVHA